MKKADRFGVVGYTVFDSSFKIDSFAKLPRVFADHSKTSIPFSNIPSLFGKRWNIDKVKETIALASNSFSLVTFSGRSINIGYQIARLGGRYNW